MVDTADREDTGPWQRVPYLNPWFARPVFVDDQVHPSAGRHCALVVMQSNGSAVAIGLRAADALELGELLTAYAQRELAGVAQQAAAAASATIQKAAGPV